jgi:hypothetical protein
MDKAQSLLLTRIIGLGYEPNFLSDPVGTAQAGLPALGLAFLDIIWGTDFKGLFGQETVPYGILASDSTGQLYAAFRGTDDAKEWLEDGWAVPEPCPFVAGGRTHQGFTDLYATLALGSKTAPVVALSGKGAIITGHSLGAALATLLAANLCTSCKECITFEGPRVGDVPFTMAMDTTVPAHFRLVIICDLVPHAPPEMLSYSHAGIEVEMDPTGKIPPGADLEEHFRNLHVLASVQTLIEAST